MIYNKAREKNREMMEKNKPRMYFAGVVMAISIVQGTPLNVLANDDIVEITPRNVETWTGTASLSMGREVTVRGVMTYANGKWGARGEILRANGQWIGAKVTGALANVGQSTVTVYIESTGGQGAAIVVHVKAV